MALLAELFSLLTNPGTFGEGSAFAERSRQPHVRADRVDPSWSSPAAA